MERLLRLSAALASPAASPAASLRALRLSGGAQAAQVARAHRRLSARVHPDKCSHPRAGDAQAVLNAARDGLLGAGGQGDAAALSESEDD